MDPDDYLKSKGKTINEIIKYRVQNNITFSFAMTRSYLVKHKILFRFPNIHRKLCTIHFENWPISALELIAERALDAGQNNFSDHNEVFVGSNATNIKLFFCRAHISLVEYLEKKSLLESAPYICSNTLKHCLEMYKFHLCKLRSFKGKTANAVKNAIFNLEQNDKAVSKMENDISLQKKSLEDQQIYIGSLSSQKELLSADESIKKKISSKLQNTWEEENKKLNKISASIAEKMSSVTPIEGKVVEALNRISADDIKSLCKIKNPPKIVALVLDAILILLHAELIPAKFGYETNESNEVNLKSSWRSATAIMKDPQNFLCKLKNFRKRNINEETIEFLQSLLLKKVFNFHAAKRASGNVAYLQMWVSAVIEFYFAYREIKPLREKEIEEKIRIKKLYTQLESAEIERKNITEMIHKTMVTINNVQKEEVVGRRRLNQIVKRFDMAKRLQMTTLSIQKDWEIQHQKTKCELQNLIGDVAIASLFFVYLGKQKEEARKNMFGIISEQLENYKIPYTRGKQTGHLFASILHLFSSEDMRSSWKLHGLSDDRHSMQNAIICFNPGPRKNPLFNRPSTSRDQMATKAILFVLASIHIPKR